MEDSKGTEERRSQGERASEKELGQLRKLRIRIRER